MAGQRGKKLLTHDRSFFCCCSWQEEEVEEGQGERGKETIPSIPEVKGRERGEGKKVAVQMVLTVASSNW